MFYNLIFSRGVTNVYEKRLFQFGGWGQGIKEAAMYVEKTAPKGSTVGLALDPIHTIPPLKTLKVSKYEITKTYDYVIVNYYFIVRDGFDDSALYNKYKLVHSVKADKGTDMYESVRNSNLSSILASFEIKSFFIESFKKIRGSMAIDVTIEVTNKNVIGATFERILFMFRPTSFDPVNAIMFTSGFSTMYLPAFFPAQGT